MQAAILLHFAGILIFLPRANLHHTKIKFQTFNINVSRFFKYIELNRGTNMLYMCSNE